MNESQTRVKNTSKNNRMKRRSYLVNNATRSGKIRAVYPTGSTISQDALNLDAKEKHNNNSLVVEGNRKQ